MSHRSTADEYLIREKGKAFPEYFYSYLKLYLQRFVVPPMVTKDELIMRLKRDLKMILQGMEVDERKTHEENSGLVSDGVWAWFTLFYQSMKRGTMKL